MSLSLATPAFAETPGDVAAARDLFKEGSQLAQEGKWDQAVARFQQSLELRRAAITLYSLGIAQKNVGRPAAALENLRAFLKWPPNAATDPYVPIAREAVTELESQVAHVKIAIVPADTRLVELRVDGARAADVALDRPRIVDPGKHEIVAQAEGGRSATASFTVTPGERKTVELVFDKASAVPAAASSAPAAAPPPPPPPTTEPTAAPPRSGSATSKSQLPTILIASGGALFAIGGTFGILAYAQAKNAPSQDSADADGAKKKALVADVVGGVGLLAAGAGVYLLLTQPKGSRETAVIRPWISPSAAGVAGTFLGCRPRRRARPERGIQIAQEPFTATAIARFRTRRRAAWRSAVTPCAEPTRIRDAQSHNSRKEPRFPRISARFALGTRVEEGTRRRREAPSDPPEQETHP